MQFGKWVQNIRNERRLDIRTFAEKTGVDPSTISRIEHLKTQATLYTAFRICESFGISLLELIKAVGENDLSALEQGSSRREGPVATLDSVENFVKAFHLREDEIRQHLVESINKLTKEMHLSNTRENNDGLSAFMPEDVDKLLFSSPIYQFRLKYPSRIKADTIIYTYEQGGAFTLPDIEVYIRKLRPRRIKSSEKIDTASLERIKLSDVLLLDNDLKEKGRIASMYWEICKFHERFNPLQQHQRYEVETLFDREREEQDVWEFKLASTYITLYRWYQYFWGDSIMPL